MYTVEMELDEIEITILDDSGQCEDLKLFSYDDVVYIRQYNRKKGEYELIVITPQMYAELMSAWQSPEGSFITNLSRDL
jgi:hypothetical protein